MAIEHKVQTLPKVEELPKEKRRELDEYFDKYLEDEDKKVKEVGGDLLKAEDVKWEEPPGYWSTAMSQLVPHKIYIRGYPLADLIGNCTYAEVLFLELFGELPDDRHRQMIDALLLSIVDAQMGGAQPYICRSVASGNPQFVPALAAGILGVGSNTVSPFDCADLINRAYTLMKGENLSYEETAKRVVKEYHDMHKRMPGFGHPHHRKYDPRAVRLFKVARQLGFLGEKTRLYIAIHDEFVKTYGKGRDIPINIDGAMACVINDMNLSPLHSIVFAILSFSIGMSAQIIEELQNPVFLRWVHNSEYVGVPPRPFPKEKVKIP